MIEKDELLTTLEADLQFILFFRVIKTGGDQSDQQSGTGRKK